jgi:RNA polymerase subunit RPABC4/transcription elongation factor Spt4
MAREYETVTVPARQEKRLVNRSCDLCGRQAKANEWGDSIFDADETEIAVSVRQREGKNYPEGGYGTKYEIDLCPDCFKKRLVPWLQSQGADIEEKDWDW